MEVLRSQWRIKRRAVLPPPLPLLFFPKNRARRDKKKIQSLTCFTTKQPPPPLLPTLIHTPLPNSFRPPPPPFHHGLRLVQSSSLVSGSSVGVSPGANDFHLARSLALVLCARSIALRAPKFHLWASLDLSLIASRSSVVLDFIYKDNSNSVLIITLTIKKITMMITY